MLELMAHQVRFCDRVAGDGRLAWFAEPGVGKTLGVLAACAAVRLPTLVLAPKSILRTAWLADARHFPDLSAVIVWSDKKPERLQQIQTPADLFITNYETFKKHTADFLAAGVRRFVVDESSKVKNHDSQIAKACAEFADRMDSVFALSGTPAPNNQTEYFGQMRLVDRRVFGSNFWKFAHYFFAPQKRTIAGRERIVGWKMMDHRRDEFYERLGRRSWTLRKADCFDLPPQTDVIREVELCSAERRAHDTMLESAQVEFANGQTLNASVQAIVMKLRQITGGGVNTPEGPRVVGESKLDELLAVLEEISPTEPVVIWAEFHQEIDRIAAALADRGIGIIDGRVNGDLRAQQIDAFQAGRLRTLVCNPAAAGHGITLTAAAYAVYFSHSFSFETYQQSRDRIYRKGQSRPTTYYHLIARDTIDERVWFALSRKASVHDTVMNLLSSPAAKKKAAHDATRPVLPLGRYAL